MPKQTFVLKSVTPVQHSGKTEDKYVYKNETTGAQIGFHMHPTKAWNFVIVQADTNPEGSALANKMVNAFCTALDAEVNGGDKEATKQLTINVR